MFNNVFSFVLLFVGICTILSGVNTAMMGGEWWPMIFGFGVGIVYAAGKESIR